MAKFLEWENDQRKWREAQKDLERKYLRGWVEEVEPGLSPEDLDERVEGLLLMMAVGRWVRWALLLSAVMAGTGLAAWLALEVWR